MTDSPSAGFGSKELRFGVSASSSATRSLDQAFSIGQEIIEAVRSKNVHVFKGAVSGGGARKEKRGVSRLSEALREERLTILVLGPATNMATVVRNHPELSGRIEQVIAVAGRREGSAIPAIAGCKIVSRSEFRDGS